MTELTQTSASEPPPAHDQIPGVAAPTGVVLDIMDHGICWFLPLGAEITAALIDLPGGAIIQGKLNGRIVCHSGSLIIASTGVLTGHGDAGRIYVDGEIRSGPKGEISSLRARQLIAVSERATGGADLVSPAFSIHTQKFSARFTTLDRL